MRVWVTLAFLLPLLAGVSWGAELSPDRTDGRTATPPPTVPGAPMEPDIPSTRAYRAAMMRTRMQMDFPYTGDPDRDFVDGMLPHHEGAVDMAEIELRYDHDPALRRLAKKIVAAQQKEIVLMNSWKRRHALDESNRNER